VKYFFATIYSAFVGLSVAFLCLIASYFIFPTKPVLPLQPSHYLPCAILGICAGIFYCWFYLRKVREQKGKEGLKQDIRTLKTVTWITVLLAIGYIAAKHFSIDAAFLLQPSNLRFEILGFGVVVLVIAYRGLRNLDKYEFENTTDGGVIEFSSYEASVSHSRKKFLYGLCLLGGFLLVALGVLIFVLGR
jgi:hypothetical protein